MHSTLPLVILLYISGLCTIHGKDSFILRICRNTNSNCEFTDMPISLTAIVPTVMKRLEHEGWNIDLHRDMFYRLEGGYRDLIPGNDPPTKDIALFNILNGYTNFFQSGIREDDIITNTRYITWSRFQHSNYGYTINIDYCTSPDRHSLPSNFTKKCS